MAPTILTFISSATTVVHGFFAVSSGGATISSLGITQFPLSANSRTAFSPKRPGNLIRLPMVDDDSVSITIFLCIRPFFRSETAEAVIFLLSTLCFLLFRGGRHQNQP